LDDAALGESLHVSSLTNFTSSIIRASLDDVSYVSQFIASSNFIRSTYLRSISENLILVPGSEDEEELGGNPAVSPSVNRGAKKSMSTAGKVFLSAFIVLFFCSILLCIKFEPVKKLRGPTLSLYNSCTTDAGTLVPFNFSWARCQRRQFFSEMDVEEQANSPLPTGWMVTDPVSQVTTVVTPRSQKARTSPAHRNSVIVASQQNARSVSDITSESGSIRSGVSRGTKLERIDEEAGADAFPDDEVDEHTSRRDSVPLSVIEFNDVEFVVHWDNADANVDMSQTTTPASADGQGGFPTEQTSNYDGDDDYTSAHSRVESRITETTAATNEENDAIDPVADSMINGNTVEVETPVRNNLTKLVDVDSLLKTPESDPRGCRYVDESLDSCLILEPRRTEWKSSLITGSVHNQNDLTGIETQGHPVKARAKAFLVSVNESSSSSYSVSSVSMMPSDCGAEFSSRDSGYNEARVVSTDVASIRVDDDKENGDEGDGAAFTATVTKDEELDLENSFATMATVTKSDLVERARMTPPHGAVSRQPSPKAVPRANARAYDEVLRSILVSRGQKSFPP
jgi:hypothetical protein